MNCHETGFDLDVVQQDRQLRRSSGFMERAYITGATGAIGMALIGELLKNDIKVMVYLRKGSKRNGQLRCFGKEVQEGRLVIRYADLAGLKEYMPDGTECAGGTGVFYHLGWGGTFGVMRNDRELQSRNVEYVLDAVRLAARLGCRHFVGAGSQAEYGRVDGTLTPDTETAPENEYGRAKLEAGKKSRVLCGKLGMGHSWVRVLSVYGPYDGKDTMIMSVIRGLLAGRRVPLTRGEQIWNYLYSEDAARALYLVGHMGALGVYCLAGSSACSLREYILKLCHEAGADEALLGFGDIPYGEGQVMKLTADISRLTDMAGFVPQVKFETGIARTIDWVRNAVPK